MTRAKVELRGRVLRAPELRRTPSGNSILRLAVDCGEAGDRLELDVVMTGEEARKLAGALRAGQLLRATGYLRSIAARSPAGIAQPRLEVAADRIVCGDGETVRELD